MTDQIQEEAFKAQMDVIKEIGFMGYRFLITLNSGAFIVLLTFLGNIDKSTMYSMDLASLKQSLGCFLAAICGTFFSMTVAYVSAQLSLVGKSMPFGKSPVGHMLWLLLPVAISFLCFLLGGILALNGISAT